MLEPTKFIIPGKGERQGSKKAFPLRAKGDSATVALLRRCARYAPPELRAEAERHLAQLPPGHYVEANNRLVINLVDDNPKVAAWKKRVAGPIAAQAHEGKPLFDGPVRNVITFFTPRPQKHFTTKGLRPEAPIYDMTEPDLFKIVRSVEDAMSGIVYCDDKQVCHVAASKQYTDTEPYIDVGVYPLYSAAGPKLF